MQGITPFLPRDTVAYLRLADGDRRFPFRPMSPGLFLIGHGPGCDLRLGVPGVPSIHSAVQVDVKAPTIIRVAASPELVVNGEPVERAQLHDGDLIEIGDVRMVFFLSAAAAESVAVNEAQEGVEATEPEPRTSDALHLVNGLETELRLIADNETRHECLHAMLKAAQQAVEAGSVPDTIRFSDYAHAHTSGHDAKTAHDQLLARLVSQEARLDDICSVLEQVVHQQQIIATALQCMADRLEGLHPAQISPMRARA